MGLAQLLTGALELALQLGRIEPDQQIAFVDARAFRDEEGDLGLAPGERRSVRERLRGFEDAGGREPDSEVALLDRGRQRLVGRRPPPEDPHGDQG